MQFRIKNKLKTKERMTFKTFRITLLFFQKKSHIEEKQTFYFLAYAESHYLAKFNLILTMSVECDYWIWYFNSISTSKVKTMVMKKLYATYSIYSRYLSNEFFDVSDIFARSHLFETEASLKTSKSLVL